MDYPKVLIFDQTFNDYSGGGITLTNLFKGWPKDRIAVISTVFMMEHVSFEVCDKYYQLGRDENRFIFPLNLLQKRHPSGLKPASNGSSRPEASKKPGLRHRFVNDHFLPFTKLVGAYHFLVRMSLSEQLKVWLNDFRPDIIYLQVTSRDSMQFAKELCNYIKVPSVIHVMDDWTETIVSKGLFKGFLRKKIDREFRELLEIVQLHLSICDAMSEEYKVRYGKKFLAFHNPIDLNAWLHYTKKSFSIDMKSIRILYSGRIGTGISESLAEVASAIDAMNSRETSIKLYIQTPSASQPILQELKKFDCVVINPLVDYTMLPKVFSEADILLMANDFTDESFKYLRFSMPTKASEYMISGTPVFLYAPEGLAVSRLFRDNDCGHCVFTQSTAEIISALKFLITNEEFRIRISRNAVDLAMQKFNAVTVRNDFHSLLAAQCGKRLAE